MSEFDDLKLAELLCARLCHDLAGPVGAAAAGAELLEDVGADAETMALVAASAGGATSRLKFFRAALGPVSAAQNGAALRDLAEGYLRTCVSAGAPGIALAWRAPEAIDGDTARLVLNLVLIARDALPRGGTVEVAVGEAAEGGPAPVAVVARGTPAALHEEALAVLAEGRAPAGPRGAQAFFARRLAERAGGRRLALATEPTGLCLRVEPGSPPAHA